MIRRGKAEGWLKLPVQSISTWASFQGVKFNNVAIEPCPGHADRGLAMVARSSLGKGVTYPLLDVPSDLVLSKERVEVYAKSDKHLREVLNAVGDFGRTARGAILIFFLIQATSCCPDVDESVGVKNAFTEYIKYLPMELLPTFWTDTERELLVGTSLFPALKAKMKSLYREYDLLRSATELIPWCQKYWWDEVDGLVSFDDWQQLDAMYRSRALEFPMIGDSIVPCIDMVNHASGSQTAALYEADRNGNGLLLLADGKTLDAGEEVTITYGDEKGACEQIFSYGFLEEDLATARDMFLGLDIPGDDPLRVAKQTFSECAPGIRLIDGPDGPHWESEYVWILCVNEEDGLQFAAVRTNEGSVELTVTWKNQELHDASELKSLLEADPMWDVYQLRAVSIIKDRLENQLRCLYDQPELADTKHGDGTTIRHGVWKLASRLRELEAALLESTYEMLDTEQHGLAESDAVRQFLDVDRQPLARVDDGSSEMSLDEDRA